MPTLEPDILNSIEAKRLITHVTQGFYDSSYIGLWMFEVMGRELDGLRAWAENVKYEAFPQTATWSLSHWEDAYGIADGKNLSIDYRRQRIMAKIVERAPLNPERIRLVAEALTGERAEVIENVAPYTFSVEVHPKELSFIDYINLLTTVRKMKPSHLAVNFKSIHPIVIFENFNYFKPVNLDVKADFLSFTERINLQTTEFYSRFDGSGIWCVLFDGARIFDGSFLFNQNTEYSLRERLTANCVSYEVSDFVNSIKNNVSLHLHAAFFNGKSKPIIFDGNRNFDGSFLFNQQLLSLGAGWFGITAALKNENIISFGLTQAVDIKTNENYKLSRFNAAVKNKSFKSLKPDVKAFCISSKVGSKVHMAGGLSDVSTAIKNSFFCDFNSITANSKVRNKQKHRLSNTGFTLNAKQTEKISAELVSDNMFYFDGSVLFDGSRKFNAEIIKEVV